MDHVPEMRGGKVDSGECLDIQDVFSVYTTSSHVVTSVHDILEMADGCLERVCWGEKAIAGLIAHFLLLALVFVASTFDSFAIGSMSTSITDLMIPRAAKCNFASSTF